MKKLITLLTIMSLWSFSANAQGGPKLSQTNANLEKTADTMEVSFGFRQFCCDKTTEAGADEVYFLILGERSDGKRMYALTRQPGTTDHWDMNDGDQGNDRDLMGGGDSHCLTNRILANFKLPKGLSYNFTILVCEEDGGTSAVYQQAAAELLADSKDPYAMAGSFILSALNKLGIKFEDTDDYMGVFGLSVTNDNGTLSSKWSAKEGIEHINPDPDFNGNQNRKEIRMNHDGSNYVGWFVVQ